MYTVDNFYKQLTVIGYATLNVFVESGTERQPNIDKPGLQVTMLIHHIITLYKTDYLLVRKNCFTIKLP